MAQWSDPRVTGAQSSLAGVGSRAGDVAFDAGLRSHMLKVYNYMASGVLLTGVVAMLFAQTELAQNLMTNPSMMSWVIILSPLVVVLAVNPLHRHSLPPPQLLLGLAFGLTPQRRTSAVGEASS